jgi:hypothetical protein
MSLFDDAQDPRDRPRDPAGTQPKVTPESLQLGGDYAYEPSDEQVDRELEDAIQRFDELDDSEPGPDGIPVQTPQTPRFQFLLGALLAVGVIAVAGVVVALVAGGGSNDDSGPWSAWKPGSDGVSALQEIANHVAPEYRMPDGTQFVTATGGPLEFQSLPTALIAPPTPTSDAQQLLEGNTAMFTLCGSAADGKCGIPGTPSTERGVLLHREAIELALYSFRYVKDVDQVVVLLPPAPANQPSPDRAMLFRRSQLKAQVQRPLAETLAPKQLNPAAAAQQPDVKLVQLLTDASLYGRTLSQAQDTTVLLVLAPLPSATTLTAAQQKALVTAAKRQAAAAKRKKAAAAKRKQAAAAKAKAKRQKSGG